MKLNSPRLQVTIDEPGQRYTGTRFDWTSLVSSVILDGESECLSQELPPGNHAKDRGYGLMCEFGIRMPVGYDDCPVGEWFTKIGLGWVRREGNDDYNFFRTYNEYEPAPFTMTKQVLPEGEGLAITMDSGIRRGYGWKLDRLWTARDNLLSCQTTLANTGSQTIVTNEYCHNFVQPQALPLKPGVRELFSRRISFSWGTPSGPEVLVNPEAVLTLTKDGVAINPALAGEFYASFIGRNLKAGSSWQLTSDGKPWISETLDCPASHCDLWGKHYVVSPELFVPLTLAPGASFTWLRSHRFGS